MSESSKTVLVVDDNVDDLEACSRSLSRSTRYNYRVFTESYPEQAVKRLGDVDCVVIDYQFPTMTGLDLLHKIRAFRPQLPVVVLTGQVDEVLAVQLLKAGADDYLSKQELGSPELDSTIAKAIDQRIANQERIGVSEQDVVNVVILDDSEDDLELCERLLNKFGKTYAVHTATRSHDLDDILKHRNIDCLLLDYSMPGKSGLEVLKEVQDSHPFVAVVLMTGQGNEKVAVDAIKGGAENYLVKSAFNADLLNTSINQAVDKKRLEKHLSTKEQDLIERESELQDINGFLKLILAAMPGYMFVKDENFRIVEANEKFLSLYPLEQRDKVIGYTTLEAYEEQEAMAFLEMDKKAFEEGKSEAHEKIRFPNGEVRTLATTKTRFTNWKNEKYILGIAHDVTERENLISLLTKSNQDLEQFAYVASHDLKSPLNAIHKIINWLDEDYVEELPDQAKEYFELIRGRVGRMSKLLDDLLQYSRIQRVLRDDDLVYLDQFKQELLHLTDSNQSLELRIVGQQVKLPKIALQIVMVNLINNAVKHHDKEQAVVDIMVKEDDARYYISVCDDGPGIAPQYAEKVFQMFQTLKPRDEIEGSGMGLALVKKVLEHYGGSISLAPHQGRGACFDILWPKRQLSAGSDTAKLEKGS